MTVIRGIVKGGKIELPVPADWPDGTEVVIEPAASCLPKIGIGESEWRDEPESLADWHAWIKTIERLEFTAEETARFADFDARSRQYNTEAVRRQHAS